MCIDILIPIYKSLFLKEKYIGLLTQRCVFHDTNLQDKSFMMIDDVKHRLTSYGSSLIFIF